MWCKNNYIKSNILKINDGLILQVLDNKWINKIAQ